MNSLKGIVIDMKNGDITCAGTGITMQNVTEVIFYCTPKELEMLAGKLRALQIGDSCTVFTADGTFEGDPVRFLVRLKQ